MSRDPKSSTPAARYSAPTALDAATSELIRAKARQLAWQIRLPRTELPDLEQDLTLHVWHRLCRFDPDRMSRAAFVRMLVGHASATVLRSRIRLTRRAPASLDVLLLAARSPNGPDEPADERAWPHPEQAHGLALDVVAVLTSLPRPLRRVAEVLKTRTVTAAARHLRMSRAAVYRKLAELREAFAAAGLEEYFPPPRTLRARRG